MFRIYKCGKPSLSLSLSENMKSYRSLSAAFGAKYLDYPAPGDPAYSKRDVKREYAAGDNLCNTTVIFINQLRAQISAGYGAGPTETTTGGRALKFYSSVRIEVKRGKQVTQGENVIGHELWIKVVKNKQAPPFRTAHTTLIYGKGVPKAMSVLDMAIDREVVKRKGSWLAYKGETLGQGKEGVAAYMDEHPELMEEITKDVLHKVAEGLGLLTEPVADEDEPVPGSVEDSVEALLEEGVLKLDIAEDE